LPTGSGAGATLGTGSGSACARVASGAITSLALAAGLAGFSRPFQREGVAGGGALRGCNRPLPDAGREPRKRMPSSIVADGLGMLPGMLQLRVVGCGAWKASSFGAADAVAEIARISASTVPARKLHRLLNPPL